MLSRKLSKKAGPKIMEPIYSVEVLVPSDKMGDVMSDLQNRRAMIEGMSSDKGFERLVARSTGRDVSLFDYASVR